MVRKVIFMIIIYLSLTFLVCSLSDWIWSLIHFYGGWPFFEIMFWGVSLPIAQSSLSLDTIYNVSVVSFWVLLDGSVLCTLLPPIIMLCMCLCVCCIWVKHLVLVDWSCLHENQVPFLICSQTYCSVVTGVLCRCIMLYIISLLVFITLVMQDCPSWSVPFISYTTLCVCLPASSC